MTRDQSVRFGGSPGDMNSFLLPIFFFLPHTTMSSMFWPEHTTLPSPCIVKCNELSYSWTEAWQPGMRSTAEAGSEREER